MKKKKRLSISVSLAIRFTFIICAVIFLLTYIFYAIQIADLNYQRTQDLNFTVNMINKRFEHEIQQSSATNFELKHVPRHINYLIYAKSNEKYTVIDTNSTDAVPLKLTKQKGKIYTKKSSDETSSTKIIYVARPLENYPNIIAQIWIDLQNDSLYRVRHHMPQLILISLLPIIIICFFIALYITKNIMNPVIKMTESAKKISSSNLDTLLPIKNNGDELDQLAKTFNDLFTRLKIDFDRERQFTSDVSHELKTPVAVILGQANLIRRWGKNDPAQLDKSISTIISETKSMDAIIQNLLQMSRIESGRIVPQKEKISVKEIFSKVNDEVISLDSTVKVNLNYEQELNIYTDYELLHQTLMILVSNSLKFCSKPLVLDFCAQTKDDKIFISVTDNGNGFAPEIISHVFERFYRGDDSHTRSVGGSGLGLSIAKTIVQSLGGSINASNDEVTKGAKITICLVQEATK